MRYIGSGGVCSVGLEKISGAITMAIEMSTYNAPRTRRIRRAYPVWAACSWKIYATVCHHGWIGIIRIGIWGRHCDLGDDVFALRKDFKGYYQPARD